MNTPILDFVHNYIDKQTARFHMPGHKGVSMLGFESMDITEVAGADALYEADGIIAQSEKNASVLFDSGCTLYSTEGSSQCLKAMLYLAVTNRSDEMSKTIVAARNVHKSFVQAAALVDFDVEWLCQSDSNSLCSCVITPKQLEAALDSLDAPPSAVYVTSPDYLGNMADIKSLADVCHKYGTILAVDNAHGAYLHFTDPAQHPLDLGADICCDSAHKTLPVLTGGAYLHIGKNAPKSFVMNVKNALSLFGSTSPSYLTLCSLDNCNRYICECYREHLSDFISKLDNLKRQLKNQHWQVLSTDPLKITICAPNGTGGVFIADKLRKNGIECEYADSEFLVLMLTPQNTDEELDRLCNVMGINDLPYSERIAKPIPKCEKICSIRQAMFAKQEVISVELAVGRICGTTTVACPPAIPIAAAGEMISKEAVDLFKHYGIDKVSVLL